MNSDSCVTVRRFVLGLITFLATAGSVGRADDGGDAQAGQAHYLHTCRPDERGLLFGGRIELDARDPAQVVDPKAQAAEGGAWASTSIWSSGPSTNRVDVVLLGDGYTAAELGVYSNDADDVFDAFFGTGGEIPLRNYRNFFNVHRVDVISAESGVDEPDLGIFRDTELDMYYNCGNVARLLCLSVSKAYAAAASAPETDQILALANSTRYGGAGYPSQNLGTLAGANSSALDIALHEFGHSFGNLADEYDYGGPTQWPGGEPSSINLTTFTTAELGAMQRKWHLWLDAANVDTFEGGGYSELGIFRPTSNSLMRSLGRPFEQVNEEQIIMKIYQIVDIIDDATPPLPAQGDYDQDTEFFLDAVTPVPDTLVYTWRVDGEIVPGANLPTLSLSQLNLGVGSFSVSVDVVDSTAKVRDETFRQSSMTGSRNWTATVDCARPIIISQPTSQGFCDDDTVAVTVVATGEDVQYQWRHEGVDLPGATESILTLPSAAQSDAGEYDVVVFNACGPRVSNSATLQWLPEVVFAGQPEDVTDCVGEAVFLFAFPQTGAAYTAQWFRNGDPVPGETGIILSFQAAQATDAGEYHLSLTSQCGTVDSQTAWLTVLPCSGVTGDLDGDADVDIDDYSLLFDCMALPDSLPLPPCVAGDIDKDGDVDFRDFVLFQVAFGTAQ